MATAADRYTDKAFSQLESDISRMYKEAQKDLRKKLQDFTRRHKAKDAEMQKKLKSGKITQAQYQQWITGQVFVGNQWKQKIEQVNSSIKGVMQNASNLTHGRSMNVFAENANYTAYQLEKDFKATINFGLYDTSTVSRLVGKDPELLPRKVVNGTKLEAWNRKVISNSISQGIIQGEGVDEISKRIARDTCIPAGRSSMLYARTAMTGAQNAGRLERLHEAKEMGINVKKRWMATLDNRTRDSHAELDGETIDIDKKFSNGLEYPGDPNGAGREVYNCRCTLVYIYPEYEQHFERTAYYEEGDPEYDLRHRNYETVRDMTYQQWVEYKQNQIRARYGGLPVGPVDNPYDGLPTGMSWGEYVQTLRDKIPADLIEELEKELMSGRGDKTMNEYWHSLIRGDSKNTRIEELLRQAKAPSGVKQEDEARKQREARITRIMKSHTVDQMTPEQKQEFSEILDGMQDKHLEIYEHLVGVHKNNNYTDGGGWYSPIDKKVEMTLNANAWEKAVGRKDSTGAWKTKFHEELHQLDHLLGMAQGGNFMAEATRCVGGKWDPPTEMGKRMGEAIRKDIVNFFNRAIDGYVEDIHKVNPQFKLKHIEDLDKPIQRDVRNAVFNLLSSDTVGTGNPAKARALLSAFTDAIGLATGDRVSPYSEGYWGHKSSYNKDGGINGATSECFAEIGSHIMRNDKEALEFLAGYMPESIKEYSSDFDEILEFLRGRGKLEYPKH